MSKTTPSNASIDAQYVVGVDDGNAMTKLVVLHGGKVVSKLAIPSRARGGIHGTTVIGDESEGPVPCYETEGSMFTVGDLADAESARFNDYPFSDMNRVIVHHALRVAGLEGKDVSIATGLPLSWFYKGDKPNADFIERKHASIMKPVKPVDGSRVAHIVGHKVFPEGLAAWVDYAVDDNGGLRCDHDETVAVIDIGGRTTDVAVVLPGRRIDHARCGSADLGGLNVVEEIRIALLKKLGHDLGGTTVEKAMRTGTLKVWGKPVDIAAEIEAAAKQVGGAIMREVDRRIGSAFDIDRILLVGGGAHLFKSIASTYPNIVVADEPEFANARGFAKYLSL